MGIETERRSIMGAEVRMEGEGNKARIVGYGAKFKVRSQDLGGFVEVIDPGFFNPAIEEAQDVRGLFNHDPSLILGRTKPRTMELVVDDIGIYYRITPGDNQAGRDAVVSIGRGDVDGSSFGFTVAEDRWDLMGDTVVRTLLKIHTLYDVGPVTYPAYPSATTGIEVAKRSMQEWKSKVSGPTGMAISVAKAKLILASH